MESGKMKAATERSPCDYTGNFEGSEASNIVARSSGSKTPSWLQSQGEGLEGAR